MAKGESGNVSGIFPPILRLVVRSCCGDCKQHGYTEIDFLYSGHNSAAKKSTEKQVREAIDDAKELSFPVSGRMKQLDYSNEYGFAPLVQSAGVSFIVAGDEPGATAKMVVKAVLNLWPLIVTVFISAFFSGIVMWLMVSVVWLFIRTWSEFFFGTSTSWLHAAHLIFNNLGFFCIVRLQSWSHLYVIFFINDSIRLGEL